MLHLVDVFATFSLSTWKSNESNSISIVSIGGKSVPKYNFAVAVPEDFKRQNVTSFYMMILLVNRISTAQMHTAQT